VLIAALEDTIFGSKRPGMVTDVVLRERLSTTARGEF
jgi:hypothetical protein